LLLDFGSIWPDFLPRGCKFPPSCEDLVECHLALCCHSHRLCRWCCSLQWPRRIKTGCFMSKICEHKQPRNCIGQTATSHPLWKLITDHFLLLTNYCRNLHNNCTNRAKPPNQISINSIPNYNSRVKKCKYKIR
jgi:hypothetical protein